MSIKDKLQKIREENEAKGLNDPALFKQRLFNGGFGLAKTFWLFWFLPILLLNIVECFITKKMVFNQIEALMIIWSIYCFYFIVKIPNRRVWSYVALVVIVLNLLLGILAIIGNLLG
ncbi:hypothetical protein [Proteus penneri]|uniref:hypothetical protein n=1 Tax=Proteus penneri TaxID=102862 RepID=UPI002889C1FA|nr:hypothetical protein [Proteus penneri]